MSKIHRYTDQAFHTPEIIQCQYREYVVPAFEYPVTWLGVAGLLAQYPLNNEEVLALRLPIDPPDGDFVFAIQWTDAGVSYRLKLWDAASTLKWPVYAGETIGIDATLEVWSVEDADAVLSADYSIYASPMAEVTDGTDSAPQTQPSDVVTLEPI